MKTKERSIDRRLVNRNSRNLICSQCQKPITDPVVLKTRTPRKPTDKNQSKWGRSYEHSDGCPKK